jgi:hypothetical protein
MPEGIKMEKLCDESHLIATNACPNVKTDYFLSDAVVDTCTLHGTGRARVEKKDIFGTTAIDVKQKAKKKTQLF